MTPVSQQRGASLRPGRGDREGKIPQNCSVFLVIKAKLIFEKVVANFENLFVVSSSVLKSGQFQPPN